MMRTLILFALSVLTLIPVAMAEPPASTHHDGFMLRVSAGPRYGYGHASGHKTGELHTHGFAAGFDVQIGYNHFDGVSVHGNFSYLRLVGRKLGVEKTNDFSLDSLTQNLSYELKSLGLGATFWLNEDNLFLSLGIGYGLLTVVDDGQQAERPDTAVGVTATSMLGREWYFADNLAIGVAGQATYALMSDRAATWSIFSIGLAITGAYD
ncbi:MAG: hypothetical protein ACI9OJ_003920 [Myxococcota bacterium]|jgi:hypothetical protein